MLLWLYQLKVDVGMLNTMKNDVACFELLWRRATVINAWNVSEIIIHCLLHTHINFQLIQSVVLLAMPMQINNNTYM